MRHVTRTYTFKERDHLARREMRDKMVQKDAGQEQGVVGMAGYIARYTRKIR